MQKTALNEALHVNVKSFELSHAIIKTDLFSKVNLKPVSRLILLTVSGMYNPKLGYSFPSVNKLSACTGYTDRQIKEGLKELSLSGIMIRTEKRIYFTKKFYALLELKNFCNQDEETSIKNEKSSSKSEVSSPPIHEHVIKQEIKTKKEPDNFSFKNLLNLFKMDTVKYSEEIKNLSESEKEKLAKVKLSRTILTDFQRENLDKFIMLSESEINSINRKEPYFRQENIDIYYNSRIKKIREYQNIQENQEQKPIDLKDEALKMLSAGYKVYSKNKRQLADFISRNKSKMARFNITESDLCL